MAIDECAAVRPFAVVPVKPLHSGKSRLAGTLPDRDRRALNRFLFDRTLNIVADYPGAGRTIVVSRSDGVLAAARARGMIPLRECRGGDLNAAVADGTKAALARGAGALLVVPVDLPLLTSRHLRAIVEEELGPVLVLVPDRHGSGTNLLYQSPVRLTAYHFGVGSCDHHVRSGVLAGMRIVTRHEACMALDVDEPADLVTWAARDPAQWYAAGLGPARRDTPAPCG